MMMQNKNENEIETVVVAGQDGNVRKLTEAGYAVIAQHGGSEGWKETDGNRVFVDYYGGVWADSYFVAATKTANGEFDAEVFFRGKLLCNCGRGFFTESDALECAQKYAKASKEAAARLTNGSLKTDWKRA